MTARTKSRITPKYKTKYKVNNWPEYEAALRKRGDVTVWFDEDAVDAWSAPATGRPGGQRRYSDLAIITVLTLRTVFHLPLRQAEGFLSSLIRLMDLDLKTPDHTTLSRRSATVEVPEFVRRGDQPIHLTIDSTGLKIMGNGEWHALKHKTSNKRRAWRKLHLAVDGVGFIIASELTESGVDDASVGVTFIDRVESAIERFTADGAYDTKAIYAALHEAASPVPNIVIPRRKTATVSEPPDDILLQRDAARCGDREDRRGWKAPVAKGGRRLSASSRRKRHVSVQADCREFASRPDGSDARGGGKDWGIRCQSNDGVWNAEFGGSFEVSRAGLG
jgi:hypothetical protein